MKILVANIGSTSLKWRMFEFASSERLIHQGSIERVRDDQRAIEDCLVELRRSGAIASEDEIAAVGFKTVVAKGVTGCARLDESVVAAMEAMNATAPAHNPAYVRGIRLFAARLPGIPLVGLFETAFYQWAPEAAMRYAVPESWSEAGVRRLGFHGASHKFIAERSAELLGRDDVADRVRLLYVNGGSTPVGEPALRVVSCHLGGSSSITGIRNGVAVGNSLGMSPQSGVPHNNRVGDLDAMAFPFALRALGLSPDEAERQLCQESGIKGLSGVSNDIRDVWEAARQGNARAQLALDVFVHEVRRWIGAYLVALNGADALVFTGGIGENRGELRAAICERMDQLGIVLDEGANARLRAREGIISAPESRVRVLVIPANEELVVAREVRRLIEVLPPHPS